MQFSISHVIPGMSRSEYERFFFDENINAEMCDRLKLERTVISCTREGSDFDREVEVTMRRQVPAWVAKIVDAQNFIYTETMHYHFGDPKSAATWQIVPKKFQRQVECAGTVTFEPHPQGVMRRVEGNVRVRIPGLSAMLERFAAREIEKSFAEAAEMTRAYVAKQKQTDLQ